MGKNQAYKAMQRSKMSSSTAAGGPGEEIEDGMVCTLPLRFLASFFFSFFLFLNIKFGGSCEIKSL
jgi:hypothetical protein